MLTLRPLLCLGTVLARFCVVAQGTFQNLDFEQAIDVPTYSGSPFIWTSNAFPGWTPYVGGVPQTEVGLDNLLYFAAGIDDGPGAVPPPLDGRFSALLGGPGIAGPTASITQSGVIPAGSESVRFLASAPLLVSFAGHSLPLQALGSGPSFSEIYSADISAYAGQYGQLLFQAGAGGIYELDDISFSTQAIPEPGVLTILGLGAVVLFLRRRGRRVVARRLGPMAFGNPTGLSSRSESAKTAQPDNAGIGRFCVSPVPKVRLNPPSAERVILRAAFGRPFGTWGRLTAKPSVETLGYSRMSLRDKDRRPGQRNSPKALGLGAAGAGRRLGLLLLLTLPGAVEGQFEYTTNNGAIDIMLYTGPGGAVTIPSSINGLPVTSIDFEAFAGLRSLASVTIPSSVTSIGQQAFWLCYSLGEATIGGGVTNMGYGAFEACFNLTNVTIADGVTSIGNDAFYYCASLASAAIPDSVTGVGNEAFDGCGGLSSVKIGNGVTGIGDDAFYEGVNPYIPSFSV